PAVIAAALQRSRALGRPAAALTFEPHPRRVFRSDEALFRLTDERAKLRLLAGTGLDGAIVLPFNTDLAALSAQDFISRILLQRFEFVGVTDGLDFHLGLHRAVSLVYLSTQGSMFGFATYDG